MFKVQVGKGANVSALGLDMVHPGTGGCINQVNLFPVGITEECPAATGRSRKN